MKVTFDACVWYNSLRFVIAFRCCAFLDEYKQPYLIGFNDAVYDLSGFATYLRQEM